MKKGIAILITSLAVLGSVAIWLILHVLHQPRDARRAAVSEIQVDGDRVLCGYASLSKQDVLLITSVSMSGVLMDSGQGDALAPKEEIEFQVMRRNIRTGSNSLVAGLSREFSTMVRKGAGFRWAVSPKGDKLLLLGYRGDEDPKWSIVCTDISGKRLSPEHSFELGVPRLACWSPDNQRWMVILVSGSWVVGITALEEGPTGEVIFGSVTNAGCLLGLLPDSRCLILRGTDAELGQGKAELTLKALPPSALSDEAKRIFLPFPCVSLSEVEAVLSPDGTQILWRLLGRQRVPSAKLTQTFPYISFSMQYRPRSVWVSSSDGTGFTCLGTLPVGSLSLGWCGRNPAFLDSSDRTVFILPVVGKGR